MKRAYKLASNYKIKGVIYFSFSCTLRVLVGILSSDLLIKHLCVLWRRRGSILALIIAVIVKVGRRAVWRMVVVGLPCSHVWRGRAWSGAWRRRIVLILARGIWWGRSIVILMMRIIMLTRICHFCKAIEDKTLRAD